MIPNVLVVIQQLVNVHHVEKDSLAANVSTNAAYQAARNVYLIQVLENQAVRNAEMALSLYLAL